MSAGLKRRLGFGLLTAYGIGVMVGAGIYVLIGTVAAAAGVWAPVGFVVAGLIAGLSALSYAEFAARVPEAAGASSYIEKGLGLHWLAVGVGLAIVVAGTVSAAAVLRGGVGYLSALIEVPEAFAIIGIGLLLAAIASVGVLESLAFASVLTVIEVAGLVAAAWAGFVAEPSPNWLAPPAPVWTGIAAATALAFFAFIGFEDMANLAEEVRDPERILPRGIIAALAVTTILYALATTAAVRALPADELAASERPLALVWQAGSGLSPGYLSAVAVAAALNGVLAQVVMATRVLFGLGQREPRLAVFHRAHRRFGTPVLATAVSGAAAVGAALVLPVETLAGLTSMLLLVVFAIVNFALIRLKRRDDTGPFRLPTWVPVAGLVTALGALAASLVMGAA